jgi:RNA polymerase-interacting CarD/CdnL/TRCF family regulator
MASSSRELFGDGHMTGRTIFFTQTMARVHVKQGNLDQAAEIYRYLIEKEPERDDLIREVAAIERQMLESAPDRLVKLFEEWFELIFQYNRIRKLRMFEKSLLRRCASAPVSDDVSP